MRNHGTCAKSEKVCLYLGVALGKVESYSESEQMSNVDPIMQGSWLQMFTGKFSCGNKRILGPNAGLMPGSQEDLVSIASTPTLANSEVVEFLRKAEWDGKFGFRTWPEAEAFNLT